MKRITKYNVTLVKEKGGLYEVPTTKCNNPYNVVKILNEVLDLSNRAEEVLVLVSLDNRLNVIGLFEVSVGTINSSLVSPREIFKRAILNNASKIIIAHNHPSGDVKPSDEDNKTTQRIQKSGELLGVPLIDHLILGEYSSYYSYKENNNIL